MSFISYIRMPAPFTVLGIFYALVAAFAIILYVQDDILHGFSAKFAKTCKANYKLLIIALLVILFIIQFLDVAVTNLCRKLYNTNVYTITDFISSMGESSFIGGALFAIALILQLLKKTRVARVYATAFMVSIVAGLCNLVPKFILNRQRPAFGSSNSWDFFHFFTSGAKSPADLLYAYNSMPSGHTITVVSALTVLYCATRSKKIKVLLVVMSLLIMYSRVYTLNHWLSDVVTAAVLGMLLGYAGYSTLKR